MLANGFAGFEGPRSWVFQQELCCRCLDTWKRVLGYTIYYQ